MQVRAKLFATLSREYTQVPSGTPLAVELPAQATIETLLEQLEVPPDEVKVAFVNGRSRPLDWTLCEGDEVGIFPPIAGG